MQCALLASGCHNRVSPSVSDLFCFRSLFILLKMLEIIKKIPHCHKQIHYFNQISWILMWTVQNWKVRYRHRPERNASCFCQIGWIWSVDPHPGQNLALSSLCPISYPHLRDTRIGIFWHIPACVFQNTCKCAPITFSWLKSNTDLWSWGGSGGHGAPADWPSGATVWWRHRRLQSPSRWPTGQRPRWATTGESCHSAWRRNRCTRRKKVSRSNSRCNRYFHCYLLDVQAWIHSWMQSRHTVASSHIWICS